MRAHHIFTNKIIFWADARRGWNHEDYFRDDVPKKKWDNIDPQWFASLEEALERIQTDKIWANQDWRLEVWNAMTDEIIPVSAL